MFLEVADFGKHTDQETHHKSDSALHGGWGRVT